MKQTWNIQYRKFVTDVHNYIALLRYAEVNGISGYAS